MRGIVWRSPAVTKAHMYDGNWCRWMLQVTFLMIMVLFVIIMTHFQGRCFVVLCECVFFYYVKAPKEMFSTLKCFNIFLHKSAKGRNSHHYIFTLSSNTICNIISLCFNVILCKIAGCPDYFTLINNLL